MDQPQRIIIKTEMHDELSSRETLLEGARQLYEAVKTTMGPRGRNVVIKRFNRPVTVTHDGVTVAKAVVVKDPGANVGAELIKNAADRMNEFAADGTTTVTVLTYHILNEAHKLIEAGANPMELKNQIEALLDGLVEHLEALTDKDVTDEKLLQAAVVSAGDEAIGKVVADVVKQIGHESVITVEQSGSVETVSEVVDGYNIDRGYVSPYFMTNTAKLTSELTDAVVVVTDMKITYNDQILPLLQMLHNASKKDILLICDDLDGDALATCVRNRIEGVFNFVAVKAPGIGQFKADLLEDFAILTGAHVVSEQKGGSFDKLDFNDFGSAGRVLVTQSKTTIIQGGGASEDIEARAAEITEQVESAEDDYHKESLKIRAAELSGKVAIIKVGGLTDQEIEEKVYRFEDAVGAAKAALQGGILPGAGYALLTVSEGLPDTPAGKLLKNALAQPAAQILANAGIDESRIEEIAEGHGINVKTGDNVNLLAEGIIDPAKITVEALKTAVSLACLSMSAGAIIVESEAQSGLSRV